ncbi:MAG: sigma-70 family RNA polymerase sigma factor [Deltaproteobacteria bacterium]|nr:sigma-70 family RNA polymerase sigma factor [Deltaproteobacteria bacterium]
MSPAFVAELQATIVRARERWPDVEGNTMEFVSALGRSLGGELEPSTGLDGLHVEDLWLATAAARGDAAAVSEVDAQLISLRPAVASSGADRTTVDEVIQRVRERLLVGSGASPAAIASYRGRGDLRSWLKVVVMREAAAWLRRARRDRTGTDDELQALVDPHADPELAWMRERYGTEFRASFAEALRGLEVTDRNLLRLYLIEQLTIDEIGALHRVHRSTAARWLVRIREQLSMRTRVLLAERLSIGLDELDTVIRVMGSRLDASIARHLEDT